MILSSFRILFTTFWDAKLYSKGSRDIRNEPGMDSQRVVQSADSEVGCVGGSCMSQRNMQPGEWLKAREGSGKIKNVKVSQTTVRCCKSTCGDQSCSAWNGSRNGREMGESAASILCHDAAGEDTQWLAKREREVKHLRETTKKTQRTYFKLKRRGRFNHVTHCCLGWLQWQSLHRPRTLEHHQPAAPHAPHSQVGINPESPVELNKTQHIIVICMNRFMFLVKERLRGGGRRGRESWRPGSPICMGAPCAVGFRWVTFTAASNNADGIGRIVTTRGHLKTPAPTQEIDVCTNMKQNCYWTSCNFWEFYTALWRKHNKMFHISQPMCVFYSITQLYQQLLNLIQYQLPITY